MTRVAGGGRRVRAQVKLDLSRHASISSRPLVNMYTCPQQRRKIICACKKRKSYVSRDVSGATVHEPGFLFRAFHGIGKLLPHQCDGLGSGEATFHQRPAGHQTAAPCPVLAAERHGAALTQKRLSCRALHFPGARQNLGRRRVIHDRMKGKRQANFHRSRFQQRESLFRQLTALDQHDEIPRALGVEPFQRLATGLGRENGGAIKAGLQPRKPRHRDLATERMISHHPH
mmetsp:Transcript_4308/g.7788  ORF Transcript_4308/g.7788 Transcript_4308/m.7788 type:complete len:230 (+) Transcript_4308:43-732(+)